MDLMVLPENWKLVFPMILPVSICIIIAGIAILLVGLWLLIACTKGWSL